MENVTLYIQNNTNGNVPVGILANPDDMDNANVVTMYKWNLTGFDAGPVYNFLSINYRPLNSAILIPFTYTAQPGTVFKSLQQIASILTSIGVSIFFVTDIAGQTYIATNTDSYVFSNLTLTVLYKPVLFIQ